MVRAAEQDAAVRAAWREAITALSSADLVFVDESSTSISLARRYGRAPRNERAVGAVPRNYGLPTSLLAALGPAGLGAVMSLAGAVDQAAFTVYVRELLCPSLRRGQVVVLDNLSAHKGTAVQALIEGAGCTLLFLPPYSPDFSPIELAFSKLKAVLRAAAARTQAALDAAIGRAIEVVTAADAQAWFQHCGYPVR